MILNLLIILLTIILMDFLGYCVLTKVNYKKDSLIFPIGFLSFFGFFELFSLIPMNIHANFNYYFISFILAIIIGYVFLSYKFLNKYIQDLKIRFKNRTNLVVLVLAIFVGLIVGIFSTISGDSWLYSPMALSCIYNNVIFSHNGIEINGTIQSFHYTDGYYLFQACLAKLGIGDDFLFIGSSFKILEGFFITTAYYGIIKGFLNKNQLPVLIIVVFSTLLGSGLFTNYIGMDEIYTHIFKSMALGINIINIGFYALMYILFTANIELKDKIKFFPLLVFSGFAFSSSTLFMMFAFLVVMFISNLLTKKDKTALLPCVSCFLTLLVFVNVYVFNISTILGIAFLIMCLIGVLILVLMFKKLSFNTLKKISIILVITYLVLTLILPLLIVNSNNFIDDVINTQDQALYYDSTHYYASNWKNIFGIILTLFGTYYIYKNNKNFGIFIIIYIIMFANPFAYRVIGELVNQSVYHRVFNMYLPGVINIIGLGYVITLVNDKLNLGKTLYVYALLIPLVFFFPKHDRILSYLEDGLMSYKLQNPVVNDIYEFDFANTPNVVVSVLPNPVPKTSGFTEDLFKLRPDLNWTDCSQPGAKYYIVPNNFPLDLEVVYQTNDVTIYYDAEDQICQINKN